MPIIDFKEIPSAKATKKNPGVQDTFELFAREVLEQIGFKILSQPSRGADRGKDLIVEETRRGVGGESKVKWLVSCKHHSPSGKSVTPEDELNILERVKMHDCQGFLGFYSTVASAGLDAILQGLKDIDSQVYDRERIERTLIGSTAGTLIAKRFFPNSVKKWEADTGAPADVMLQTDDLLCAHTGENLLVPRPRGIVVLVRPYDSKSKSIHYEDVYWCLKGEPDRILRRPYEKRGMLTEWEDIPDVAIPVAYLRWCMAVVNQLREGATYSDHAFEKLKQFLIALFPYATRNMRPEEKKRVRSLMSLPFTGWARS